MPWGLSFCKEGQAFALSSSRQLHEPGIMTDFAAANFTSPANSTPFTHSKNNS
jgi:hypothetical protein